MEYKWKIHSQFEWWIYTVNGIWYMCIRLFDIIRITWYFWVVHPPVWNTWHHSRKNLYLILSFIYLVVTNINLEMNPNSFLIYIKMKIKSNTRSQFWLLISLLFTVVLHAFQFDAIKFHPKVNKIWLKIVSRFFQETNICKWCQF